MIKGICKGECGERAGYIVSCSHSHCEHVVRDIEISKEQKEILKQKFIETLDSISFEKEL